MNLNFFVKIIFTLFLMVLIPVYWFNYGISNFLWFSDISLFLTFFALWFRWPLLISMAVVGIMPFELAWTVEYFYQLLTGKEILGMTEYMFDPQYSPFLRSLSLFHIFVPIIWVTYLIKWGYHKHAFICQLVLTEIVLLITYFFTAPGLNIDWVFSPISFHWHLLTVREWLGIMMVGMPTVIFFPLNYFLKTYFLKRSENFSIIK